jgi:tyrosinase
MSNDKPNGQPPVKPNIFTSEPMTFNIKELESSFKRADVELYGVDHSGPSYEGRVFLNNPEANEDTPITIEKGYVGSYYVFGHGGCYADEGHCDLKERSPFDFRPPDPNERYDYHLKITEQIRKLGKDTIKFTVTIVPILAGGSVILDTDVVTLESISIVTYNK